MIYVLICCLIIIGFLGVKLYQKQKIDQQALDDYQYQIDTARDMLHDLSVKQCADMQRSAKYKAQYEDYKRKCEYEQYKLEECKKDLQAALDTYHDITDNKLKEIDNSIEEQRQKRQQELDSVLEEKQNYYNKLLEDTINQCNSQAEIIKEASEVKRREAVEQIERYDKFIAEAKERFESIERTLRQYDAEQQAKLFYTIQLPEEYQEDIEFLLTTVAAKVQHPDIISKLVWAEYVKPNLDDTFKRIEIKAEPGIYKLTSLINGKCYVGKSTDVKKRITDHFKSTVGIKSIADQLVHHAILKEGFWNWQIEIITYCDKEKLSELEKYYIEFFKAQEFGYNRNAGG